MTLSTLADEYLETIDALTKHLALLEYQLQTTQSFEVRRKIREKINSHETVLRQTLHTYHYIKNYYDKNSSIKSWI